MARRRVRARLTPPNGRSNDQCAMHVTSSTFFLSHRSLNDQGTNTGPKATSASNAQVRGGGHSGPRVVRVRMLDEQLATRAHYGDDHGLWMIIGAWMHTYVGIRPGQAIPHSQNKPR